MICRNCGAHFAPFGVKNRLAVLNNDEPGICSTDCEEDFNCLHSANMAMDEYRPIYEHLIKGMGELEFVSC